MNPFDPYFARIRDFQSDLKDQGREIHTWHANDLTYHPEEVEPKYISPIVLKENTAVELGGPQTASSTFLIWTADHSLISDRRIMLVGPDIASNRDGVLPFGQVVLFGGKALNKEVQPRLERELHTAGQYPGYMVRSTGGRIWSRVTYEALENGFSMSVLGASILQQFSTGSATVAEVLFITSSVKDVQSLDKIGLQVRKLSHDLRRERLKETVDGHYICENEISCEACPDNDVCLEIREVLTIRKKLVKTNSIKKHIAP